MKAMENYAAKKGNPHGEYDNPGGDTFKLAILELMAAFEKGDSKDACEAFKAAFMECYHEME